MDADRGYALRGIDFLSSFYALRFDGPSLVDAADSLLQSTVGLEAKVLPVYCREPIARWLYEQVPQRRRGGMRPNGDGSVHLVEYQYQPRSGDPTLALGRAITWDVPDFPDVHLIFTVEPVSFYQGIRTMVGRAYPQTATTFITHQRLYNWLKGFETTYGLSISIRRGGFRLRLGSEQGAMAPMLVWPRITLDEAFDWLRLNNGVCQWLRFDAKRERRTVGSILVGRDGATRTTGIFPAVFQGFVWPACRTIDENVRFFGGRGRREQDGMRARPLSITFEDDRLASGPERRRLLEVLTRLRTASVSVLHGNPYLHVSVLDYFDGSSFDVWVVSADAVTIVPQMKATVPSVKRLISHIFDEYGEGPITDVQGGS